MMTGQRKEIPDTMKQCKTCNRRLIHEHQEDGFCSDECRREYEDQMDRLRRRAGKGKKKSIYTDPWKPIINIMKKHNCQYPEAVEIYEKEKKK